ERNRLHLEAQRLAAAKAEQHVRFSIDLRLDQLAQFRVLWERGPTTAVRGLERPLLCRGGRLTGLPAEPPVEPTQRSGERRGRAEEGQSRRQYDHEPSNTSPLRARDDVWPVGEPLWLGRIGVELIEHVRAELVHGRTSCSKRRSEPWAALSVAPTVPVETCKAV